MLRSHVFRSVSTMEPTPRTPAEFTTPSTGPKSFTTLANRACTAPASATSTPAASARSDLAPAPSRVCCAFACSRSTDTTLAPSSSRRRTVAAPMPLPPPVTRKILFSNRFMAVSLDPVERAQRRYCSAVTCSSHTTALPSSISVMAICVTAVVGDAPCQCFSPAGMKTTSPGRMSSIGPPSRCAQPQPAVTISVCPRGWVCQAVLAAGSKVLEPQTTRPGASASQSMSRRTVPVN